MDVFNAVMAADEALQDWRHRALDAEATVKAQREEIERLTRLWKGASKECTRYAREAGFAKGKLEASEMAGVVDGWKERALAAEARLASSDGGGT